MIETANRVRATVRIRVGIKFLASIYVYETLVYIHHVEGVKIVSHTVEPPLSGHFRDLAKEFA